MQGKTKFTIRRFDAPPMLETDFLFGNFRDHGDILAAVAVEERYGITGCKAPYVCEMMGFGAVENELPDFERFGGVETIRHADHQRSEG